jgi:hypothetical protein
LACSDDVHPPDTAHLELALHAIDADQSIPRFILFIPFFSSRAALFSTTLLIQLRVAVLNGELKMQDLFGPLQPEQSNSLESLVNVSAWIDSGLTALA